jgi:hypothetical protein
MARFHCLIRPFAALVDRPAVVPPNTLRALRALRLDDAEVAAEVPEPQGPGWFDSSWELVRGLDVREGLPGDAGVYEWLDVCLRSDAAAPTAAATAASAASIAFQRGLRAASFATSRATASPTSITAIA